MLLVSPAGRGAERGEGEQRSPERSPGRAGGETALPAEPGGGAGESAQTGDLLPPKESDVAHEFGFYENMNWKLP